MKFFFVIFLMVTGSAFAQDAPLNEPDMTTPTCVTYVEWTGKKIDEIDLSILKGRTYRILKPDSMMTMDYSPNRLNINITDEGVILTQECG